MPNPIPSPNDQIATPEGDNEFAPDQLISPLEEQALEDPPGSKSANRSEPQTDAHEKQPEAKPKGLEKFIDEVAHGEFM